MEYRNSHDSYNGRVYCQDSHATPYVYLGFSCPVTCTNIMEAVKRLKLLEEQGLHDKSISYISRRHSDEDARTLYLTCERIFKNKMATEEVQKELHEYNTCRLYLQNGYSSVKMAVNMTKCYRRSYRQQFLKIFTKILNKHAHGMYKFTDDMSALILEKIIGEEEALRDRNMDIKKILHFLKKALTIHASTGHAEQITLRSKHCLMLNVPGCYCRTGFVENSGQCVKPTDCLTNSMYLKYMSRVHLL